MMMMMMMNPTPSEQLYVPVAHALGLGSKLKEMEELSYKALFPESYDKFAIWHKNFADMGQVVSHLTHAATPIRGPFG